MNFEQITHVLEVYKSGTFSESSEILGISQSGLSQSINRLEEEIGFKIFDRTRFGALITKKGEVFIEQAQIVNNSYQELMGTIKTLNDELNNTLKIAITTSLGNFLNEKIMTLINRNVNLKISVQNFNSNEIINKIKSDDLDMGFVVINRSNRHTVENLDFFPIISGALRLYCPKKLYQSNFSNSFSVDIVSAQEVFLFNDEYINQFVKYFESNFSELNITLKTDSLDAALQTAYEFNGITFAREVQFNNSSLEEIKNNFVVISIDSLGDFTHQYGWIKKKTKLLEPKEEKIVRYLTQCD